MSHIAMPSRRRRASSSFETGARAKNKVNIRNETPSRVETRKRDENEHPAHLAHSARAGRVESGRGRRANRMARCNENLGGDLIRTRPANRRGRIRNECDFENFLQADRNTDFHDSAKIKQLAIF
ncbi:MULTISPECIES: hypothetical protein [Burkholderia]|uniref:hypothetical protein n=1 Tax=Burkholderia TaxID=32008 RepID=UPI000ACC2C13|nr:MULTISPECIES: hypothetical protein [Burkholderia]